MVAVVSVAVSGAVAMGVPFISAHFERARLREQAAEARVDELREVLDGAARLLRAATGNLTWLHGALLGATGGDPSPHLAQLVEDTEAGGDLVARLQVRLGSDAELTQLFAQAFAAVALAYAPLQELAGGNGSTDELAERFEKRLSDATGKQRAFLDAAARLVGPETPRITRGLREGAAGHSTSEPRPSTDQ